MGSLRGVGRAPRRTFAGAWPRLEQDREVSVPHRFPALIAAPPRAEGRLWLTGGRVFDGTGGAVRDGIAVLVEDGIIRRVASASEPCPEGARLLDLGQRTLLPGLIDAHTHAAGHVPQTLRGRRAGAARDRGAFPAGRAARVPAAASPRSGSPAPRASGRRRPVRRCATARSAVPAC